MNTLVRNIHDNEPMNDGPLNFAVKPTRLPEHDHSPGGEAPRVNFPPPDDLDELKALEPPWKQNKQPSVFCWRGCRGGSGGSARLGPRPNSRPEPPCQIGKYRYSAMVNGRQDQLAAPRPRNKYRDGSDMIERSDHDPPSIEPHLGERD